VLQWTPPADDAEDESEEADKPAAAASAAPPQPIRITIENTVRHGPLAGWRLAAAVVETRVSAIDGVDDTMRKAFEKVSSPTLTTVRNPGAEQTITESALIACESSVIYRRRMLGKVSVAAVADLVLFDEENPRSLAFQFERLRANLKALPSSSGSTRPERLVEEMGARLRRLDPADLEDITDGTRPVLAELLDGMHDNLRKLSGLITATHLSLPGGMQPLWGPDQLRVVP
jgi:hypothetical protein